MFYRATRSHIENHLWRNHWNGRKIQWTNKSLRSNGGTSICFIAKIFDKPFRLFHNRLWKWNHGVAKSNVVIHEFFYSSFSLYLSWPSHYIWNFSATRFPFDIKNLFGYLIAFTLQGCMIAFSLFFVSSLISLLIGSYFMLTSLTKDLQKELNWIDDSLENEENCVQIVTQLSEFVQFHSESKQFSKFGGHLIFFVYHNGISEPNNSNYNWCVCFFYRLVKICSAAFQPNAILIVFWGISGISNSMLMLQIEMVQYFDVNFW